MEAKRTKGAWKTHRNIGRKGEIGIIADKAPCIIAIMGNQKQWPIEAEANAAFIVRACNSHEELLGACEKVLDIINSYSHIPAQFKACEILQAAIAKAKGE